MKKLLFMALATGLFVACANNENNDPSLESIDRNTAPPMEESQMPVETYSPKEGDITYRNDKVLVMKNGEWVEAESEITLDNGVVIYPDGKVKKDGKKVELEDGEVIDKTGNFFDRTGRTIEKGWSEVKEEAKEAGKDIKDATKKAGEKIKSTVDDNP